MKSNEIVYNSYKDAIVVTAIAARRQISSFPFAIVASAKAINERWFHYQNEHVQQPF